MLSFLRNFFGQRATSAGGLTRLGAASPVGFRLPADLVHRAVSGSESTVTLEGDQPIELRMSFLRDQTKDLTTPELEAECLIRMRPEAEVFRFGPNPVIAESAEMQEAHGLVVHLHHTISVRGFICTATLEMLPEQVPPPALHKFRDALPEIFGSLQPMPAQADAA